MSIRGFIPADEGGYTVEVPALQARGLPIPDDRDTVLKRISVPLAGDRSGPYGSGVPPHPDRSFRRILIGAKGRPGCSWVVRFRVSARRTRLNLARRG